MTPTPSPSRALAAGAACWCVVATLRRVQRVAVEGASMEPTLRAGDHLLVVRGLPVTSGAVVAVRDPRPGGRLLVKRVRCVSALGVDVRGDNPDQSTDSRTFGPVDPALVRGVALWRYHPRHRAGPLRRTGRGPRPPAGHRQ